LPQIWSPKATWLAVPLPLSTLLVLPQAAVAAVKARPTTAAATRLFRDIRFLRNQATLERVANRCGR
jgi:hypothetical protein